MKPLLSVICYNRKEDTRRTLLALHETGAFEEAHVVIFDNCSRDGTSKMLFDLVDEGILDGDKLYFSNKNIGCPRALNWVLEHNRTPGQHFIKVDNDVEPITPGWVGKLVAFLDDHQEVMIASPWYSELDEPHAQARIVARCEGWIGMFPIAGHCVIHRANLLDETGYFDVLSDDHLYGFEDNLMCYRARMMRGECAVVAGIELRNIQRHNSMDAAAKAGEQIELHTDHLRRLRPAYQRRIDVIQRWGLRYFVNRDGRACEKQRSRTP